MLLVKKKIEVIKWHKNNVNIKGYAYIKDIDINEKNLNEIIRNVISKFVKNHKLSQAAHEEIRKRDSDIIQLKGPTRCIASHARFQCQA